MKKYALNMYISDDDCAVFTTTFAGTDNKLSQTAMVVAETLDSKTIGDTLLALMVKMRIAGVINDSHEVPDAPTERPPATSI